MPRETASRLVGTLAHPLNRPRFDAAPAPRRRGLRRPAAAGQLSLTAARRSRLRAAAGRRRRASTRTRRPSPTSTRTCSASARFTGKGIYDVDAFEAATGPAFPDNHILSHDLIEGNFARCGLVSDIELFDDFPARYHAYARREHRWVRGDWQLLPWLGRRVPIASADGEASSPQSAAARGALEDPRQPAPQPGAAGAGRLLAARLDGPARLALASGRSFGLAVPFLPLLVESAVLAVAVGGTAVGGSCGRLATSGPARWRPPVRSCSRPPSCRIRRGCWSMPSRGRSSACFVTRRDLLEWETAAAAERRLGNSLGDFVRFMWRARWSSAIALASLVAVIHPAALPAALPVLLAWLAAPALAFWVSQPGLRADAATDAGRARRDAADRPQDLGLLRDVRRRRGPLAAAGQLPGGAQGRGRPPHLADQHGPVAGRQPGGARPRLPQPCAGCSTARHWRWTRSTGWSSTAATSSTGTTRARWPRCEPRYVSTVDSGNLLACLLVLRQGLLEKARVADRRPVRRWRAWPTRCAIGSGRPACGSPQLAAAVDG